MRPGHLGHRLGGDRGALGLAQLRRVVGHPAVAVVLFGLLAGLLEDALQAVPEAGQHRLGVLGADVATADQRLGVELADAALLLDQVVHPRLGEARVVALVVAAAPVADHVQHDVLVEPLPVLERELRDPGAGLGVVAVDVEDRRLDGLRDVGAVDRGARIQRRGGEADLVVDHHMDGAAGLVRTQLAHLQRLVHHALPGEGRVPVQQDRQHRVAVDARELVELGPGDALQHRVDRLEMAGVRGHRGLDRLSGQGGEPALGAQVVLDVAGALREPRVDVALELLEDLAVALADDVGQHVQPAPVRHADAHLVQAGVGRLIAQLVQQHDGGLAALEAEPLLADEFGLQEGLEDLGLVQPVQDAQVLVARPGGVRHLHPLLDPGPLLVVLDVHVLDADAATVGAPQGRQDVAQRHDLAVVAAEIADRELAIQVPQGQAVVLQGELGMGTLPVLQRIDVGHQVAELPVGGDQREHPGRLRDLSRTLGADVLRPADRRIRDAQRGEDLVVEAVLAEQQFVDHLEELAGLRALDDAVVVGGGQRGHLRHPGVGDPALR